jgi:hypothetical protein
MIEKTGQGYFAHKTGFTPRLLGDTLRRAGFAHVHELPPLGQFEIRVVALRAAPAAYYQQLLGLQEPAPPGLTA